MRGSKEQEQGIGQFVKNNIPAFFAAAVLFGAAATHIDPKYDSSSPPSESLALVVPKGVRGQVLYPENNFYIGRVAIQAKSREAGIAIQTDTLSYILQRYSDPNSFFVIIVADAKNDSEVAELMQQARLPINITPSQNPEGSLYQLKIKTSVLSVRMAVKNLLTTGVFKNQKEATKEEFLKEVSNETSALLANRLTHPSLEEMSIEDRLKRKDKFYKGFKQTGTKFVEIFELKEQLIRDIEATGFKFIPSR